MKKKKLNEKENDIVLPKTKKQKLNLKHQRLLFIVVFLVLILISIIVISQEPKNNKTEKKETTTTTTKAYTGNLSVYDENSKTRPYAVMIPNDSVAKKRHYGLQKAYLVYEITVEGGITRLMALFKDVNVEKVGPVRSSRHYYLDYALENDAIYVHFGWSPQAQTDIPNLGINNLNGIYNPSSMFWRDKNYSSPNNAFTSTDNIKKAAEAKNYRMTSDNYALLKYSKELDISNDESAKTANNVVANYQNNCFVKYQYDETTGNYLRFNNSTADIDLSTNEQIRVKNIIIVKMDNTNISGDEKGRQELGNIGSGEGIYVANGKAINITWNKDARGNKTIYKNSKGEEINVSDGNTYIQIIPSSKTYTIE